MNVLLNKIFIQYWKKKHVDMTSKNKILIIRFKNNDKYCKFNGTNLNYNLLVDLYYRAYYVRIMGKKGIYLRATKK